METQKTKTVKVGDRCFVKLLSHKAIQSRVEELGQELRFAYADKKPLFIVILNGAFMFASDLVRACPIECEIQFVRLASYTGMESSGKITQVFGMQVPIVGRHVIVVEDIVDTGRTMHHFKENLFLSNPASVEFVTLLLKPGTLAFPFESDYVGFELDDEFVIGYGLDLDGVARNLRDIYQLENDQGNY